MTDQTIPDVTDDDRRRAREWAEGIEANPKSWSLLTRTAARVILNATPTPPPSLPTLADMTPEERAACRWMQADALNRSVRYVIANPCDAEGDAALTSAYGEIEWFSPDRVTPRPDLPRMEWPGEAPVPPNTLAVGSVWDDLDDLIAACRKSGRDQIVVTESDGDVSVWNKSIDGWTPSSPTVGYEPFTIIHAGKEADQ